MWHSQKSLCGNKTYKQKNQKVVQYLSAEGKEYFDYILKEDDTLYKYHLKHVNKNYKRTTITAQSVAAALADLRQLNSDLSALNLPASVQYALMAIGSGLSVGAVDGPLPVADIVGVIISLGGVAVFAYNWPKIEKKWPKIIKSFKKCFDGMKTKVSKAFDKVKVKAQNVYYSQDFHNFEYHYNKHAKEFKDLKGSNGKKPNRNKYYNKAKRFLKAKKSKKILQGKDRYNPKRVIKFNKATLEYLVYDANTKKIISYYLAQHSVYKEDNLTVKQWAAVALAYALSRIAK